MRHIAAMEADRRAELFQASALQMGLQPMIVEKDFWVCYMLDHLFHESIYADIWAFKGCQVPVAPVRQRPKRSVENQLIKIVSFN